MMLRMQLQVSRVNLLKSITNSLTQNPEKCSLAGVQHLTARFHDMHESFLPEHAYSKINWPGDLICHPYFVLRVDKQELDILNNANMKSADLTKALMHKNRSINCY